MISSSGTSNFMPGLLAERRWASDICAYLPLERFTVALDGPPKGGLWLITGFRKSHYDTLDRVDRFRACRIGIGNHTAFDHIVVGIERQFDNLEGHD